MCVCVCACASVCRARVRVCVSVGVGVCICVCCACLFVCVAEARHDLCSFANKPFQTRDLVPYLYHVEQGQNCDLTIF